MITMSVLFLYFIICLLHAIQGEWIDPYSMDTSAKSRIKEFSHNNVDCIATHSKPKCVSDIYLKRIVRLILNNAHLETSEDEESLTGHLNLQLSRKEFDFLQDFSRKDDIHDAVEVGSIFEVAFQKTSYNKYKEMILSFEEELYLIIFNPTTGALAAACLFSYTIYKLLMANFTWKSIFKYLAFLIYLVDFVISYLRILQKEEIDNMVKIKKLGTVPPECDPKKMSFSTYISTQFASLFSENPCKAYYEATYQKWTYLVTPTKVFGYQFRELIVQPIADLGEAFGKFGRALFTSLPWGWNIAIFPIMMITTCAIIFMVFLFFTNGHFKLSLFHIFTIEVGQSTTNKSPRIQQRNRRNNRSREMIGYVSNHRALVQEVNGGPVDHDRYSANQESQLVQISANDKMPQASRNSEELNNDSNTSAHDENSSSNSLNVND